MPSKITDTIPIVPEPAGAKLTRNWTQHPGGEWFLEFLGGVWTLALPETETEVLVRIVGIQFGGRFLVALRLSLALGLASLR